MIIHGLGAAIERAILIAQNLVRDGAGSLYMSPTTSSVSLIDDYEPLNNVPSILLDSTHYFQDLEPFSQVRYNSAIHITVAKRNKST